MLSKNEPTVFERAYLASPMQLDSEKKKDRIAIEIPQTLVSFVLALQDCKSRN